VKTVILAGLAALAMAPAAAHAQAAGATHIPAPARPDGGQPAFSAAVWGGDTLYVSGTTDGGAALGGTPADAAKRVMDNIKRTVEAGGLTMDDLTWVQVFSSNLADYDAFNTVYRTYFKGPLPARAYLGADHLLGGARFEVMGIAVRPRK
jgi:2-iminobutanoate/2-iminopropanoate deaminase